MRIPTLLPTAFASSTMLTPDLGRRSPKTERVNCGYRLGHPGRNPKRPTLNFLGFDNSVSVAAVGGHDPLGNRFDEARRAVDWVARVANRSVLVGVLHFDQPSMGDVPPVPIADRHALSRVRASLHVPKDARGTSELGPLMRRSAAIARQYPEHDAFLTLFTDFEITDADPGSVFTQLVEFPGIVHAVVLNRSAPVDLLADNIIVTEVMYGDAPGSVAAAVHASLTATRPGRRDSSVLINTRPSISPTAPGESAPMKVRP